METVHVYCKSRSTAEFAEIKVKCLMSKTIFSMTSVWNPRF